MWSFSSFWPPDLIVSPSSFLCCCHPQFVAHQLKERGNISPPPPPPTTATTNHHHQPSLLFCAAAGFCWTITQRDLYWYWFALWWDVFQPLRAERGEYKRTVRRMNCCRLVFGASGDALIGVCGPCASPLDRDISWKHFPQPSLSLWSLFLLLLFIFPILLPVWTFGWFEGAQAHHGGLDVEILFWSFVYCLESGPVPGAHPGVHLLEHNKHQVSAAQKPPQTQ